MYTVDSLLTGNWEALWSSIRHIALPAITLAFAMTAPTIRITRAAMLEVLASGYIRAARAYGVPRRKVIYRDALKNALLPVVTTTGVQYGYSLGGEVLIEMTFAWPGMGLYAVNSILSNDFAPVQAFVIVSALLYVLINLVVDIAYAALDPRITY
jgi:peptide/nickel transport system permease protein